MNSVGMALDLRFERSRPIQEALKTLAISDGEDRGAVYTRSQVVEFILNLAGYTTDRDLASARLLEPSFGSGEFLFACVERLLISYATHGGSNENALEALRDSIVAVELHADTFCDVRRRLCGFLIDHGLSSTVSAQLADVWLVCDDFLLTEICGDFSYVVGNPPYVRQEQIPPALINEYRRRYSTIYDRADLYIPFIERGLRLLGPHGTLAYICANRWTKNRYGGPLRQLIARDFHLRHYVDMDGTDAFEGTVSAYPGVFVISREQGGPTSIARPPELTPLFLSTLVTALQEDQDNVSYGVERVELTVMGSEPWMLDSSAAINVLRKLEKEFPTLEEDGCVVGIGVATGADKVYIRPCMDLPVEESRKVPIVMTTDIKSGAIEWKGNCVLNPFEPSGELAAFEAYPLFAAYLRKHEATLRKRHVGKRSETRWYRTIDRIYQDLTQRPKLLIPDIKGTANIVYDDGHYYPHHNLYYVISDTWDLRALQTILRSSIAQFFVALYCVKMRGGYLRFQAQYVRRIRLPRWDRLSEEQRLRLTMAATMDRSHCDVIAYDVYGLTAHEQSIINAFSNDEGPLDR